MKKKTRHELIQEFCKHNDCVIPEGIENAFVEYISTMVNDSDLLLAIGENSVTFNEAEANHAANLLYTACADGEDGAVLTGTILTVAVELIAAGGPPALKLFVSQVFDTVDRERRDAEPKETPTNTRYN